MTSASGIEDEAGSASGPSRRLSGCLRLLSALQAAHANLGALVGRAASSKQSSSFGSISRGFL